jgi:hypothetical protein
MSSGTGFKSLVQKVIQRFTAKKPLDGINGVFFGGNHFLRVVNQPEGRPEYVSDVSNAVTSFQLASNYGNIGLIAHNYLSGQYFDDLKLGDHIYTMNGFRQQRIYQVTSIRRFQALNPRSARSDFIDLDTRQRLTVNDVFRQIYTGEHHLTLQTCIQRGGNREWGRLFIIAKPIFTIPQGNNDYRANP